MHNWIDLVTRAVLVASILHTFLPPWDADPFRAFPTFTKYYKVVIYVIGYVAINARSTVYKSISINNPNGTNAPNGGAK
jgi:hypothetical protein